MNGTGDVRVTTAGATARLGDEPVTVQPGDVTASTRRHLARRLAPVDRDGRHRVEVVVDGWRFELLVEDAVRASLRERASRDRATVGTSGESLEIRAIIPGRIVAVAVAPGDTVEAGQTLLAVEAMKMQNELRAPRAGTIAGIPVDVGSTVEVGDVLVVLA